MPKTAISVTLDEENVTWLRGRARAAGARSVSDLLDRIVSAARESGGFVPSRSVAGTIDIDASDPLLERADAAVRDAFEHSLGRLLAVREPRAAYGRSGKSKGRHGRS